MQDNTVIDKLQKRAKRKYLNVPTLKALLALDSPLHDKYHNTLTCSHRILQQDGKIQSRYCKRLWCSVCSPIRTAIRINNYREPLEALNDLQLTTLTWRNVPRSDIRLSIQHFRQVFRQFRNTYKKATGETFKGVYNFEVTYNPKTKLYHPHIHIIHEGIELENTGLLRKDGEPHTINKLVRYWLKKAPGTTDIKAQDCRPCTDLIEGFKYQAKSIFKIKINGKKEPFIPAIELDAIYQELTGLRCFQPFGIEKVVSEEDEEKQMDQLTAYQVNKPEGSYLWKDHDWHLTQHIDGETGEELHDIRETKNIVVIETPLTGFKPNKDLQAYHQKLTANEHYQSSPLEKKADKNTAHQPKGIWTVHRSEEFLFPKVPVPYLSRFGREKARGIFNEYRYSKN